MEDIRIYAFADESSPALGGQIAAMKRNGLQGLEIRNVDQLNVADITEEKAKEIRRELDDAGLVTWSIGSPIGKIDIEKDDFASHLEKFRHCLSVADILGAGNMRIFSFYWPHEKDPALFRNQILDRLSQMVEIARGTGIVLCHENEKGIYGDMADRCLEILRQVPEMRGVFDPANFIQCHQDTWEAWKMLKSYIKYVHIKDALLADGSVVPAGCGDGNVQKIVSEYLSGGGRDFTMEPHLADFVGLSGLEQEGNTSVVGKIAFQSNDEAFDFACNAFKKLL